MNIINMGFGINNKIITDNQFKKLKLKHHENSIFKILDNNNENE